MQIDILALDDVFDTGLSTVIDAFTTANELARMTGIDAPEFDCRIVGVTESVHSAQGLSVPVKPIRPRARPDWLFLPAIGAKMPDALQTALLRPDVHQACQAITHYAQRQTRIAAACIGTFILAETGLLDEREATTTWWLTPLFRQRYPSVKLDAAHMIVNAGACVTAGAALGHMDLALWIIRQSSPELADTVARYLIVDSRPSQTAYAISDHLSHADPMVTGFDHWAREHLQSGFSLDAAAAALATSKRTLARRVSESLGKSPLEHVQDLRVERAIHLLKTSSLTVEQVADKVGYANGTTLRTLLRRKMGRGLRDVRGV